MRHRSESSRHGNRERRPSDSHDSHRRRRHVRSSPEGGRDTSAEKRSRRRRYNEGSASADDSREKMDVNPAAQKMQDPSFRSMIMEALKERNLLIPQEEEALEDGEDREHRDGTTPTLPEALIQHTSDTWQPMALEETSAACEEAGEATVDAIEEYTASNLRLQTPSPEAPCTAEPVIPQGLHEARMIDHYEFMTNISQGTYGVVYLGKCLKTNRYKAFKRVKKQQKDGRPEAFPLTSLREINILSSLHHPNIVGLQEVCLSSGRGILKVMDYAEFDLKRVLEMKKESFSASEIKCIIKQILQALHFLHDHWIMHRDLKPSNILYDSKGNIKLCDFGLARHYGEPLGNYTPLVVTLFYRAPELLLGMEKYSPAIDMWSLGCIFAEIVLGHPLFQETTELAMLSKILTTIGEPTESTWAEFTSLPNAKSIQLTGETENRLPSMFSSGYAVSGPELLTKEGVDFLCGLLTLNPHDRLTAQEALDHEYFREFPPPCHRRLLPTFVDTKQNKFS